MMLFSYLKNLSVFSFYVQNKFYGIPGPLWPGTKFARHKVTCNYCFTLYIEQDIHIVHVPNETFILPF